MYQSIGIHVDADDDIIASADPDSIVAVQVHARSGTASIVISPTGPGGIAVVDRLIAALAECRTELLRRLPRTLEVVRGTAAPGSYEAGHRAPHHDFAARPVSFSLDAIPGAGDPDGESADAPDSGR